MNGFLFNQIVFGPVISRRLGVSLGINLLPESGKICTFDCIYCECGFNELEVTKRELPTRHEVFNAIEEKLIMMKETNDPPDSITLAGNGEPTLHPDFPGIIDDMISLRDKIFPAAAISLLSNGTTISRPEIFKAMLKVNNNILKLDAGSEIMFRKLNRFHGSATIADFVNLLCKFEGKLIIQSLFVRGNFENESIDNTTNEEIDLWLGHIKKINPKSVMVYSIARPTPARDLMKVSKAELEHIAQKVKGLGVEAQAY